MGPLEGVKVVDMTTVLMGPYATQMLGDYGADRDQGGIARWRRDAADRPDPPSRHGSGLPQHQSQQAHICLDLKSPTAATLLKLIEKADVLTYNMRPHTMAKLHLDYDSVSKVNPRIIYCRLFGFSQGPHAGRPADDDLIQGASTISPLIQTSNGEIRAMSPTRSPTASPASPPSTPSWRRSSIADRTARARTSTSRCSRP